MSRPKPTVLLEHIDKDSYRVEQILESKTMYGVFYEDTAILIKAFNKHGSNPVPKYKKTVFSSLGNADAMAERLNKRYSTDKFNVKEVL